MKICFAENPRISKYEKSLLLCQFQNIKLAKQNFANSRKFHLNAAKILLKTTLIFLDFFFGFFIFFSFCILRISAAKIFTWLFVSEIFFYGKYQNIKVRKKLLLWQFQNMELETQSYAESKIFTLLFLS